MTSNVYGTSSPFPGFFSATSYKLISPWHSNQELAIASEQIQTWVWIKSLSWGANPGTDSHAILWLLVQMQWQVLGLHLPCQHESSCKMRSKGVWVGRRQHAAAGASSYCDFLWIDSAPELNHSCASDTTPSWSPSKLNLASTLRDGDGTS